VAADGHRAVRLRRSPVAAFAAGAAVGGLGGLGGLGGMIGLRGAEVGLPLLIELFGFVALQAVIVNKAMCLAVILTALPARLGAVPCTALARTGRSRSTCWPAASSAPGPVPRGPAACREEGERSSV